MGRRWRSLEERQFDMKSEKQLESLQYASKLDKLKFKLSQAKVSLAHWKNLVYQLEQQVEMEGIKVYKKLDKAIENVNHCPSCKKLHLESPPAECWKKAWDPILLYRTERGKVFDAYLRKNKWGSLDMT